MIELKLKMSLLIFVMANQTIFIIYYILKVIKLNYYKLKNFIEEESTLKNILKIINKKLIHFFEY
jgi:hypothetical protein